MSIQCVAWVLGQDIKPAIAKLAMIAIANYADEHGKCWPSNARLARDCSYDKGELRKVLHRLQEAGWLAIQERYQDGAQLTNVLTINLPMGGVAEHPQGGGGQPPGGERASHLGGSVPATPRTIIEPSVEPKDSPSGESGARKRAKAPSERASRLQKDWVLPLAWKAWAMENLSPDEAVVTAEADRFRDHWIAAAGANARKLDWAATWRNWCRRAKPLRQASGPRPINRDELPAWRRDQLNGFDEMEAIMARRKARYAAEQAAKAGAH